MDYKSIADASAGMTVEEAYAAMSVETSAVVNPLSGNQLRVWAALNATDYSSLKAAAAVSVPAEMALGLVSDSGAVLDLSSASVNGLIDALVVGGVISQAGRDSLFQLASTAEKAWPGVTQGHIKKAQELRARGEI